MARAALFVALLVAHASRTAATSSPPAPPAPAPPPPFPPVPPGTPSTAGTAPLSFGNPFNYLAGVLNVSLPYGPVVLLGASGNHIAGTLSNVAFVTVPVLEPVSGATFSGIAFFAPNSGSGNSMFCPSDINGTTFVLGVTVACGAAAQAVLTGVTYPPCVLSSLLLHPSFCDPSPPPSPVQPSAPPAPPSPPSPPSPPALSPAPPAPPPVFTCAVQDAQCFALGDFYRATNGPTSWDLSAAEGWLPTSVSGWDAAAAGNATPYCSFFGVVCIGETVILMCDQACMVAEARSLIYAGLSGTLPESLTSLTGLTDFSVYKNSLTGTVPSWLGSIPGLNLLILSRNLFYGTIPASLSSLAGLQDFEAHDNSLTGTLPDTFASLTALGHLALSSNQLTGTLPPWLGNLTTLVLLDVSNNQLSGTLPDIFTPLVSLARLGLRRGPGRSGRWPPTDALRSGNLFVGSLPTYLLAWPVSSSYSLSGGVGNTTRPYLAQPLECAAITVCTAGTAATGLVFNDYEPPGTWLYPAPVCTPCADGTVAPANGARYCYNCSAGTYAAGDGVSCIACPANTVSPVGSTNVSACSCLTSYVPAGAGCALCPAGTVFDFNKVACVRCPRGSYSAQAGVSACTLNPPGFVNIDATSVAPCPAGTALDAAQACAPCPLGSYSPQAGASACTLNPPGYVNLNATSVAPCPAGTALDAAQACTPCQAGTAAPAGAAACVVCRAGTWANTSSCAACSVGATSPDLAADASACVCLAGYDAAPDGSCVASSGALTASQIAGAVVGSVSGGLLLLVLAVALATRRALRRRVADARYRAVVARAEDVALGDTLGSGGFGSVYRATWRGAEVAVKVLAAGGPRPPARPAAPHATSSSTLSSVNPDFAREVVFLSQLRHPNIAAMYAIVLEPKLMLVMELGTAGSLQSLLERASLASFNWLQRVTCGSGVAAGVEFLHSQKPPVIHLDLKSANVVLDAALCPKICDFGISLFASKGTDSVTRGTLRYMAPEVARGQRIENLPAVDVYGLGCIVHDLLHANTGVSGAQTAAVAARLAGAPGPSASGGSLAPNPVFARVMRGFEPALGGRLPPELSALLASLLAVDPSVRPSARDARAAIGGLAAASLTWPLDGGGGSGAAETVITE